MSGDQKLITFFFLVGLLPFCCACSEQAPEYDIVALDGDRLRIPLAQVNDGGVHFFTYKYQGKNINFFVRTDGQGRLRTHFDACYSCFKYKKGYVHEGTQVICIACRIGYDLQDPIWDYVGACVPITLKSSMAGNWLVVKQSHLEKGERFF